MGFLFVSICYLSILYFFFFFFSFENRDLGIFDVDYEDGFFVRIFWLGDLGGFWVLIGGLVGRYDWGLGMGCEDFVMIVI